MSICIYKFPALRYAFVCFIYIYVTFRRFLQHITQVFLEKSGIIIDIFYKQFYNIIYNICVFYTILHYLFIAVTCLMALLREVFLWN